MDQINSQLTLLSLSAAGAVGIASFYFWQKKSNQSISSDMVKAPEFSLKPIDDQMKIKINVKKLPGKGEEDSRSDKASVGIYSDPSVVQAQLSKLHIASSSGSTTSDRESIKQSIMKAKDWADQNDDDFSIDDFSQTDSDGFSTSAAPPLQASPVVKKLFNPQYPQKKFRSSNTSSNGFRKGYAAPRKFIREYKYTARQTPSQHMTHVFRCGDSSNFYSSSKSPKFIPKIKAASVITSSPESSASPNSVLQSSPRPSSSYSSRTPPVRGNAELTKDTISNDHHCDEASQSSVDSGNATGNVSPYSSMTPPIFYTTSVAAAAPPPPSRSAAAGAAGIIALPQMVYELRLAQDSVGVFIGRNGRTISWIERKSGASVMLRKDSTHENTQICSIEGTEYSIDCALDMIRQRFDDIDLTQINKPQAADSQTTSPFGLAAYGAETSITPSPPPATCTPIHLAMAPQQLQQGVPPHILHSVPPSVSSTPTILTSASPTELVQLGLPDDGMDSVPVEVQISSIISAGHIFVQLPNDPTYSSLYHLNYCMKGCYTYSEDVPALPSPLVGVICACPEGDEWYRAQVVSVYHESQECDVRYMDYGGFVRIKSNLLRQIRSDFMSLPFQAIECYLANIAPLEGEEEFSQEAFALLDQLTFEQRLSCRIVAKNEDGTPFVELVATPQMDMMFNVNYQLINQGVVRGITPPSPFLIKPGGPYTSSTASPVPPACLVGLPHTAPVLTSTAPPVAAVISPVDMALITPPQSATFVPTAAPAAQLHLPIVTATSLSDNGASQTTPPPPPAAASDKCADSTGAINVDTGVTTSSDVSPTTSDSTLSSLSPTSSIGGEEKEAAAALIKAAVVGESVTTTSIKAPENEN